MYERPFFITEKISNNAFNYEKRPHKQIYVPHLQTGTVDDVLIGTEIVFEDFDDDDTLHSCIGLKNFIKTYFGSVPVYVFDNHNHAFAFWCQEKYHGNLQNDALLIHIDQHKDTRTPACFINEADAQDLSKVFKYTNTVLNVGNFIPAAQHIGLVKEMIFLDSQYSLQNIQEQLELKPQQGGIPDRNLILDIDLDFFAPESDYIGNDLKLRIIEKLIPKASVITFATSPYFIDQKRALEWLHSIALKAFRTLNIKEN